MNQLQFDIAAWRAVGEYMPDEAAWRQWVSNPQQWQAERVPYRPPLPFLPALQRRRMGLSSRLIFDAAWPLLAQDEHCPTVFVSHDGEINRSFELWLSLLREHAVSPTSFALSVHNAQVGQWSMLRGDMSENTALCVRSDGFETAFVEAYCLLEEGAQRVLLLAADEPLHAEYEIADGVRAPFAYAFACVLTRGSGCTLAFDTRCADTVSDDGAHMRDYAGALAWIREVLTAQQGETVSFVRRYPHRTWHWQCRT